ncbi:MULTISPECIES: acyl-CoA synthetase [Streptomyces]|uniref:Acyl-CoA synthetase n=2 Tax=Streptomyces TaxID=1883 RepID=A0A3R7FAI7_9ACTN|nr:MULTISPECIES: acyl-CoA synthetase [Streptomyces]KNE83679.1 AMP-binding protein [Streptomyces fradiae]OFA51105.1 acyl-CoA synthetase [Streptomyces fradiae]PQM20283.1 acyl-CoA synthetase [Streptomyces xinghaiensis]RKM93946.1 acyl-CoA synthetase [Streptomyces xinghaiensis]RNC69449.1 acyl-CoA synthetase [Streptomyces xinghaiensis]
MTLPPTDLLWPASDSPADPAAIEAVPLHERGLPATTYDALLRAARLWPGHPALTVLPEAARFLHPATVTFAQLRDQVHRTANLLRSLGVTRRAAVGLLAPNTAELPAALLAAQAAGIAAPVNPGLASEHVEQLLRRGGARVLVAAGPQLDPQVWATARQVAAALRLDALLALAPTAAEGSSPAQPAALEPVEGVRVGYLAELAASHPADRLVDIEPPAAGDLAAYFHTGGTTGTPKLAAHTHANQVVNAWMVASGIPLERDSVMFAALPLFHVNALIVTVLGPLLRGRRVVWAGPLGYRDPQLYGVFWKLVEHYHIAAMSAVPTVYSVLAQVPVDADISGMRFAAVGASPLPPAVRESFEQHTGIPLCEGYGLTEATCASTLGVPGRTRPGSVGRRLPYQQVKTVRIDPDTGEWHDLPPGATGVLAISGPAVFAGYVAGHTDRGPRLETTGKIRDGWLDTGDLARIDADGFVHLAGRAKDLIIRGGHNIDPAGIEDALLAHPEVTAAAAVGCPDPHAGEVPVAYAALGPGAEADPAELLAWATERVSERAAAPREVIVIDAIPLTAVGKPYKLGLRLDATRRAVLAELAAQGADCDPERIVCRPHDGGVRVLVPAPADEAVRQRVTAALDRYVLTWQYAPGT